MDLDFLKNSQKITMVQPIIPPSIAPSSIASSPIAPSPIATSLEINRRINVIIYIIY